MKAADKHSRVLKQRNRIAFAYMELNKDRNFHQLVPNKRNKLIEDVLKVGDEIADWAMAEFNTKDPRKIAQQLGVKVYGEDKGIIGKLIKRSEYRPQNKEIIIFRDSLEHMMRQVEIGELRERLLRYLVAHELFHHLERTKFGEVYKKFQILAWEVGPFKRYKVIRRISEVAAQAFTQRLLGLEFSPRVFDYLTYVLYTASSAAC